ncbi:DsbE family thiol:disulfide interchange protein [Craterilacuibacter sp. RT1T]|uniref:DsbE family thiol:disulfide interchange protein n=1 Tax=Craterilacuibacter sp. RT1T TaxID=2942211 RepID=UPI0020C06C92|nr:DsbE family thiol:disulfide interchange protein [Craterilacuibacter sp. RT1T]MCL6263832.1 DsbE family thiol:disulfide interchange protein [Craterilacuibacter sp. RT1T]
MKKQWIWALPLAVFVVMVGFFAASLDKDPRELPSQRLDKPAPAFNLPQLANPQASFAPAQMHGQVWLLNVWASWCAACRSEHEIVTQLARHVPIVGLNQQDEAQAARAWLTELGDPYLLSASDDDGRVSIDYGVYGVPETFVIDKQGVIRYRHLGPITRETMQDTLLPLIRKLQA